jgi:phosphatidylserine/phosphatidylglycerophosphate/cardiolipin synthase-like enzyme
MVGSANLDYRSMRLNFELNLMFHSAVQNTVLARIPRARLFAVPGNRSGDLRATALSRKIRGGGAAAAVAAALR